MRKDKCAGIVTVTLWFHSPQHIARICQSINILIEVGLSKIYVVKDIKTTIPDEKLLIHEYVEIVHADVFETCLKWYIGLKKAFTDGWQFGFVFPGDVVYYEERLLQQNEGLQKKLVGRLDEMLQFEEGLVIGDYDVPLKTSNPKYQLSINGAYQFLETFFPQITSELKEHKIDFPRTEFFIISARFFEDYFEKRYSKWMPWEATLQLLVFAKKNKIPIRRFLLGNIGDTDVQRKKEFEITNQLLRMLYTVSYEYFKYEGYQATDTQLPPGWISKLNRSFDVILNYVRPNFIVTIDGPTGTGKSTIASLMAKEMNWLYIDGGIYFRALTVKALIEQVNVEYEPELEALANSTAIKMKIAHSSATSPYQYQILIDDKDVTTDLRALQVSQSVPVVSKHPKIRAMRNAWIRSLAIDHCIIAEGRTLGSEIFPEANIKFFLDAALENRTDRRYSQLLQKGEVISKELVRQSILERDQSDRKGFIDRLEQQPDTFYLDTSQLGIDAVLHILKQNILPRFNKWKEKKIES